MTTPQSGAGPWLALAVGSLILAGLLSLMLVVGRTPLFGALAADPAFFKRCLVVHVVLALVVWFASFQTALFHLLPARSPRSPVAVVGAAVAAAGVALLCVAAALPGVEPVLSNYVPVVDHPLFFAGLAAVAAGTTISLLDGRLLPGREPTSSPSLLPPASRVFARAAATAFVIAVLTFIAAGLATPRDLPPSSRHELVFWGGGHVLQVASTAGMLAAWGALLTPALGRPPVGRAAAALLGALLILPILAAPVVAGGGTTRPAYSLTFTRFMQLGLFPVVLTYLALCLRAVARARASLRDPRVVAFASSATLAVAGFVLGALIRGSSTMIPAHYHASIGAVTVAYMAVTYRILDTLGAPVPTARLRRLAAWQPLLLGVGQLGFAAGFALAGAHGMARKAYGAEQHVRSTPELVGLALMAAGGLVAVAGGLSYLGIVIAAWRARAARGRTAWTAESIRSRG